MRKTAVYRDDLFLEHQPGFDHVESPDRLQVIYDELDRRGPASNLVYPHFSPASAEIIGLVHSPSLIRKVAETAGKRQDFLDSDTRTSARTYEAACLAAGSLIDGMQRIVNGEVDNAFCLVRPPGHHAEKNRAMGFCIFNNVAIAAAWALSCMGMERILILDWDLHHGNGTQKSFYESKKVLYFSTHQYPLYPGTGTLLETGKGEGEGFTLNVPMPGGQGDQDFFRIFNDLLVPVARQYRPDFILVSCGFDIYGGDPLGTMRVTPAGFAGMTRIVQRLAAEACQGRLLITLEGGYNLNGLRDGSLAVLTALSGKKVGIDFPDFAEKGRGGSEKGDQPLYLKQAISLAKSYWKM
ncbi:MAG TPA: histone deacetylase [Desulfobulbaceae bacterium]|nr:histone deacetylase [Desulfobulbaceae bacterium]